MAAKNIVEQEVSPLINYGAYDNDLEDQKTAINAKISSYEHKLVDLEIKESMLNNIITRTNSQLENIDPTNFKWVGQTQSNLMKQIENLGLLKDIIIKYEDMIFKYRKTLIEMNEKSLANRVKVNSLLAEEKKEDDNINTILQNIQNMIDGNNDKIDLDEDTNIQNKLLLEVQQELEAEQY